MHSDGAGSSPVWSTALICMQFYTTTPNRDFPFRAADPLIKIIFRGARLQLDSSITLSH